MDIRFKRIVITGTSSGIGWEFLKLISGYDGTKILCVDLQSNPSLIELKNSTNNIEVMEMDISSPDAVEKVIRKANVFMGGIDILFANAGFAYYEEIQKPDWNRIEKIFKTNVFSPFYSLAYMNSHAKEPFLFIVTASAMSLLPIPGYSLYASTKASVHSFMDCFRYELKKGNRIMVVYPIATRSKFFDTAGNSVPIPFPAQSTQSVAKSIVRGILKNKNKVYPSIIFRSMLALDRFLLFPLKIYRFIEGKKFKKYMQSFMKNSV